MPTQSVVVDCAFITTEGVTMQSSRCSIQKEAPPSVAWARTQARVASSRVMFSAQCRSSRSNAMTATAPSTMAQPTRTAISVGLMPVVSCLFPTDQ